MDTTIQISKSLLETLKKRKISFKESYEDIIWDLLEDTMVLSDETRRDIEESRKQYKEGKTVSLKEIKKKLNLK